MATTNAFIRPVAELHIIFLFKLSAITHKKAPCIKHYACTLGLKDRHCKFLSIFCFLGLHPCDQNLYLRNNYFKVNGKTCGNSCVGLQFPLRFHKLLHFSILFKLIIFFNILFKVCPFMGWAVTKNWS